MNALVSMHGIWLLVFAPLAGVVAWRYSGPMMRKLALFASVATSVGIVGWFGFHSVVGTELTGSVYDRAMHSFGMIFGAVNFPVIQLLLALLVIVCWPRRFEFNSANAKTDVNTNPDPDPVPMPVLDAELQ